MKYKHVVFDLDGTLLDSDRSLFLAWRDTFRQFGKYCSDEEIYASFGKTRWDIFGMFGVDKPDEFWEAWKKNYKRLSADVGFFDGVNDLLGELKERGIKTGLVTSRAREELDAYFSDLLKGVFSMMPDTLMRLPPRCARTIRRNTSPIRSRCFITPRGRGSSRKIAFISAICRRTYVAPMRRGRIRRLSYGKKNGKKRRNKRARNISFIR